MVYHKLFSNFSNHISGHEIGVYENFADLTCATRNFIFKFKFWTFVHILRAYMLLEKSLSWKDFSWGSISFRLQMVFLITPKSYQKASVFRVRTLQLKSFQLNDFFNYTFQLHVSRCERYFENCNFLGN